MEYIVEVRWDEEANVWYAFNDSMPLALESDSFDTLIERVKIVAAEILQDNGAGQNPFSLYFRAERKESVA